MCQTYIRLLQLIPMGSSFDERTLPHERVHWSSPATTWIGWAAGAWTPVSWSSDSFFHISSSPFIFKTFVFLVDARTDVCYNMFGATILGRRLVLLTEDCDLWSHRNLFAEILWKEDCVHVDDGTIYIHYQLMYYLFCSWVYHWFSEQ